MLTEVLSFFCALAYHPWLLNPERVLIAFQLLLTYSSELLCHLVGCIPTLSNKISTPILEESSSKICPSV
jgi:hypothetical protein